MNSSRLTWLAVLGLVGFLGYRYWASQQIPAPTLEPGEHAGGPSLAAPERVRISREETPTAMLIAQERHDTDGRVGGTVPAVFERPTISSDSLALAKPRAPAPEEGPWWRHLSPEVSVALILVAFLIVYGALTAALRRGPGGGGMTND